MTEQETATLLTMIQRTYRNFFKGEFDPKGFKAEVVMWQGIFKDASYQEVSVALGAWISEEPYPPTPANLNRILKKAKNPEIFISPESAWEQVHNAVKRFGWVHERQALQSLTEPIQRAIRNIGGWQKICATPLGREWDFLRKNFMDVFEDFGEESQSQAMIPVSVWNRLQELNQGDIKELEDNINELPEM